MNHEKYIRRCFDLARLGAGQVSPNPMVGAALVHEGRIIGEGWHREYGGPHAEVNALADVGENERPLIPLSTLYVSLEPCCIFGRTPPCTDLILKNKIPKVVISAIDLTPEVGGQGVSVLREAGVEVVTGILQKEGEALAAPRNVFVTKKRPYIILKFAQTKDGFIGKKGEQVWISNVYSKRLVHRLRSQSDAILVGTNTALTDNPQLTNRLWFGTSPLRILFDSRLKVATSQFIFSEKNKILVVTEKEPPQSNGENVEYLQLPFDKLLLPGLLFYLFEKKTSTLIVEGGAFTLRKFLDENLWDEAHVYTADKLLHEGIEAPRIKTGPHSSHPIGPDVLTIFRNPASLR